MDWFKSHFRQIHLLEKHLERCRGAIIPAFIKIIDKGKASPRF